MEIAQVQLSEQESQSKMMILVLLLLVCTAFNFELAVICHKSWPQLLKVWLGLTSVSKLSTSDNAILAFSLVLWIAVVSDYTCVCPCMEMSAANGALHEIFRGKPSFVYKKMDEKSRFGELSTEEIQEIVDNAVPATTKKPQSWG